MGRTSLTFPKVIHLFPVVLLNIPSGPMFTGTVDEPNIIDQVIQHFLVVLKVGWGTPDKRSIWADVSGDSEWAENL